MTGPATSHYYPVGHETAMQDPAALVNQLLLKHRHGILAYLYSALHDYHAVEDVFQEVCLVAFQKAGDFRPGTNFPAWIRAIAFHKLREHLRTRRGVSAEEAFFHAMEGAFRKLDEEGELERRKDALRQCLDQVEERVRRFLVLRYVDGLPPGTIARETDQTRVSVNSLLQRIREKLRSCIERRLALKGG
jgi:RNA polymerase sigma-70 factor (ECF subfamily)